MKEKPIINGTRSIGIHFGFLCDPITKQLKAQGFKYDHKTVKCFESLLDKLLTVHLASLIPDSTKEKGLQKLYNKIVAHVKKQNKLV